MRPHIPVTEKEIHMAQFETRKATRQGRDTTLQRRRQRALKQRTGTGIEALAASILISREGHR